MNKAFKTVQKRDFGEIIIENKELIYPLLFYFFGLVLGSLLYSGTNGLNEVYKSVFEFNKRELSVLIIARLGVYFTVFSLTVLLSLCMVGFPIINAVPLVYGFLLALKLSYYYSFKLSGICNSLLLIIPENALFITILLFTVKNSYLLSKNIFFSATKNSDITDEFNIKSYLKLFFVYSVLIALCAIINSLLIYFISPLTGLK